MLQTSHVNVNMMVCTTSNKMAISAENHKLHFEKQLIHSISLKKKAKPMLEKEGLKQLNI